MRIAAWNGESGGFDGYDQKATRPQHLDAILHLVAQIAPDIIGIIDAYRWDEVMDWSLWGKLGYVRWFHTRLEDDRVEPAIGIAALSKRDDVEFRSVWLGNRQAIKAVVPTTAGPARVYFVYFYDLSEDSRMESARALWEDAGQDPLLPVAALGDFNCAPAGELPAMLRLAGRLARSGAGQWATRRVPGDLAYGTRAVGELTRGEVVPALRRRFTEVNLRGPTAFPVLGGVRLQLQADRIFVRNWRFAGGTVWPGGGRDHLAISAEFED